jgi:hypothetical protein
MYGAFRISRLKYWKASLHKRFGLLITNYLSSAKSLSEALIKIQLKPNKSRQRKEQAIEKVDLLTSRQLTKISNT